MVGQGLQVGMFLARGSAVVQAACDGVPGVSVSTFGSAGALQAGLGGFDAVIVQNTVYDAEFAGLVARAGRLRWIQAAASGVDAFQRLGVRPGVVVTNAGDTWAACVADHAMALVLGSMRGLALAERNRQARRWDQQGVGDRMVGMRGKRMLMVGLGAIGRGVARRAEAFGMVVEAVTRSPDRSGAVWRVAGAEQLLERLTEADVVVLCLPLTVQSAGLIGRAALAAMKADAVLVNVSRGGVIDEAALLEALAAGRLAGVGLDVAAAEPLDPASALWSYDRVCITPHVAAYDDGPGFELLGALCRDNLERFRDGRGLRNVVPIS